MLLLEEVQTVVIIEFPRSRKRRHITAASCIARRASIVSGVQTIASCLTPTVPQWLGSSALDVPQQ